jgi:hypothetical protein
MATHRVKEISKTLDEVKSKHRFLKVSMKGKDHSTNRVYIAGRDATWAKDKEVVFSPSTHLAGKKAVVVDFLKSRIERNDPSAEVILKTFETDPKMITFETKDAPKNVDYMTNITLLHQKEAKERSPSAARMVLPERDDIPDFLAHYLELRNQAGAGGRSSKADIIQVYMDKVAGTTKVIRIYGCDPDGKSNDRQLSVAERDQLSKTTIPLADSGFLNQVYVPAHTDSTRSVVNFMTLLYMHTEGLKQSEAVTKARTFATDLLAQYKKVRGRKASPSGRSLSAKPRSSSRPASRAGSVARASGSRKASKSPARSTRAVSKSPARSAVRAVSKSPARSASRPASRAASPMKSRSVSRGRAVSPKRSAETSPKKSSSPGPGTSPKQPATTTRTFRIPKKPSA